MGRGGRGDMRGAMLGPAHEAAASATAGEPGAAAAAHLKPANPTTRRRAAWATEASSFAGPRSRGFLYIPQPVGRRTSQLAERSAASLHTNQALGACKPQAADLLGRRRPRPPGGAQQRPGPGAGAVQQLLVDRVEGERAQLLAIRRRTKALFNGAGRFSSAEGRGRQSDRCARLSAALPVTPPKLPTLNATVKEPPLNPLRPRSTPRSARGATVQEVPSPAVSVVRSPTGIITDMAPVVRSPTASKAHTPPGATTITPQGVSSAFLFQSTSAPMAQRVTMRSLVTPAPRARTADLVTRSSDSGLRDWNRRPAGTHSGSETAVRLHRNVAAVSLTVPARRQLELKKMTSRGEIYALNAVLARAAEAQFQRLAAGKAAEATKAKADGGALDDLYGVGGTDDSDGEPEMISSHPNRPGAAYGSPSPDAPPAGGADEDDDEEEDGTGAQRSEQGAGAARVATQLSLLQGMTTAGVLTEQQAEAAVAKLATASPTAAVAENTVEPAAATVEASGGVSICIACEDSVCSCKEILISSPPLAGAGDGGA